MCLIFLAPIVVLIVPIGELYCANKSFFWHFNVIKESKALFWILITLSDQKLTKIQEEAIAPGRRKTRIGRKKKERSINFNCFIKFFAFIFIRTPR